MPASEVLTHVRHRSALGVWEQVVRRPDPRLRPYVRSLEGFDERMPGPLRRVEPASTDIVVVVGWGPPVGLGVGAREPDEQLSAFVVGPRTGPLTAASSGVQVGVQVSLTPLGARLVLDAPLGVLAGRPVAAGEVLAAGVRATMSRLADAGSWPERLDLVEAALGARFDATVPPVAEVAHAWHLLRSTAGTMPVAAIAAEVGWSRQRLHTTVRRDLGLAPQDLRRLLRFGHAVALLHEDGLPLAAVAAHAGYADQPHLNRDFRAFAGTSPSRYLAARLPDAGGVRAA
ncbi:MAG: helix-turn-helix domain-containing protein [Actinomycetota bacterium]|nr:helix-turn-helix domain-containing protein [Actinomycetota bacterium]